jgi:hypothetical protein
LIRIEEEAPTPKASFLHQKLGAGISLSSFFLREVRVWCLTKKKNEGERTKKNTFFASATQ